MTSVSIWQAIDQLFALLVEVVKNKAGGQDSAAKQLLKRAFEVYTNATNQLQTFAKSPRNQNDHQSAVHLSRILQNAAGPLLIAMQECFGAQKHDYQIPRSIGEAIESQMAGLDYEAIARYVNSLNQEMSVGEALEVTSEPDDLGVGQTVWALRALLGEPQRAHLARSYISSLGKLSADCGSVEVGPGVEVGIGDVRASNARILLAQRYLAANGEW